MLQGFLSCGLDLRMLLLVVLSVLNILDLLFRQQSFTDTLINFAAMTAGGLVALFLYAASRKR